jgi:WD40 repeat protein
MAVSTTGSDYKGLRSQDPKCHLEAVWAMALSADGKRALSGSSDKTLTVWDIEAYVFPRQWHSITEK